MADKRHLPARLLQGLLNRLKKLDVVIEPFFTVREGDVRAERSASSRAFRLGFLSPSDIDELVRLEPDASRQEIIDWFDKGMLCFGVWDESQLVAKMWCDLDEFSFPPNRRKLASDEVYLFAAFADPTYRGQGLAPMMRSAGYDALRELGRSRFLSYTDFFNTPARRFKEKLGAQNESLRLHVGLFGKWSRTVTLRRYQ